MFQYTNVQSSNVDCTDVPTAERCGIYINRHWSKWAVKRDGQASLSMWNFAVKWFFQRISKWRQDTLNIIWETQRFCTRLSNLQVSGYIIESQLKVSPCHAGDCLLNIYTTFIFLVYKPIFVKSLPFCSLKSESWGWTNQTFASFLQHQFCEECQSSVFEVVDHFR